MLMGREIYSSALLPHGILKPEVTGYKVTGLYIYYYLRDRRYPENIIIIYVRNFCKSCNFVTIYKKSPKNRAFQMLQHRLQVRMLLVTCNHACGCKWDNKLMLRPVSCAFLGLFLPAFCPFFIQNRIPGRKGAKNAPRITTPWTALKMPRRNAGKKGQLLEAVPCVKGMI